MKLLGSLLASSAFAQTTLSPSSFPSQLKELEQGCIDVISNIPGTDERFVETWTIKDGIYLI